jgi:hypothetical protein
MQENSGREIEVGQREDKSRARSESKDRDRDSNKDRKRDEG